MKSAIQQFRAGPIAVAISEGSIHRRKWRIVHSRPCEKLPSLTRGLRGCRNKGCYCHLLYHCRSNCSLSLSKRDAPQLVRHSHIIRQLQQVLPQSERLTTLRCSCPGGPKTFVGLVFVTQLPHAGNTAHEVAYVIVVGRYLLHVRKLSRAKRSRTHLFFRSSNRSRTLQSFDEINMSSQIRNAIRTVVPLRRHGSLE